MIVGCRELIASLLLQHLLEQIVDHLRIGFAAGGFHDLTDEEVEGPLLATISGGREGGGQPELDPIALGHHEQGEAAVRRHSDEIRVPSKKRCLPRYCERCFQAIHR